MANSDAGTNRTEVLLPLTQLQASTAQQGTSPQRGIGSYRQSRKVYESGTTLMREIDSFRGYRLSWY